MKEQRTLILLNGHLVTIDEYREWIKDQQRQLLARTLCRLSEINLHPFSSFQLSKVNVAMAIINLAPSSLDEIIERINHERVRDGFAPVNHVFYPVNRGFSVDENLLRITRNTLSSLIVDLPQVGTNAIGHVQVKRISMPTKGETLEDYLNRIDNILKDLDDHAKFVEL